MSEEVVRDSDTWMSPIDVVMACVRAWGRPALDPCWHPNSPVPAMRAICLPVNVDADAALDIRARRDVSVMRGDGLMFSWRSWTIAPGAWIWLNPPYSDPGPWLDKLVRCGRPACALVKADPSTEAWADSVWHGSDRVGFFRKRLAFGGPSDGSAKFPCALVLYGGLSVPDVDVVWTRVERVDLRVAAAR